MCGICGAFAYGDGAPPVDRSELLRVRDAMRRRGPDGEGLWVSADGRIGLGHRRLAIIDLSEAGAQPMSTRDGRLRVTFNGEIYNYRALRAALEEKGYRFDSSSDTEVLLHLYAERGADMVHALRGMYAFAIWDERARELFLARDPFGIKPLYYADNGGTFRFASQVKALLKSDGIDTAPDPAGAVGFFVWGSVPEPHTLYRGIRSIPAGSYMRVNRAGDISTTRFFDVADEFRKAENAPDRERTTRELVRDALSDSVRHHLVSDVPVGLFLSAGIDSTSLASIASTQRSTTLNAVTLGFPEFEGTAQNEVPIASTAARHFGIEHHAHLITREHFEAEIENIFEAMDQPSIDGVNTYFVSRAAAAAGMKVVLSGLGGDELFGGYPSFRQIPVVVERLRFARSAPALGRHLRRMVAPWIGLVTSPKYAGAVEYGTTYGGAFLLRRGLFMPWELDSVLDPATVATGLETLAIPEALDASLRGLWQPRSRVAALELGWYMRNQLLRDADWAGMTHSVEIRVPFVDVELFSALAPSVVSEHYPTKSDVASVLPSPLTRLIANRQKTGFVTPLEQWAAAVTGGSTGERGLRSWSRCVLSRTAGYFRAGSEVSASNSRIPSGAVSRASVPSAADAVRSGGGGDLRLGHGSRRVS